jgi:phage terminase large subunit GpA-like protein
MTTIADIRTRALRSLIPPPRLQLSEWIEQTIKLPQDVSALPGPMRLWEFQRGIADAIGNPEIERVSVIKCVRVGYSSLLNAAIANFCVNEPAAILMLQPTESDCRDAVVSEIEPIFDATPLLRGLLSPDSETGERNTLTSRRFPGGSLRVIAARAPRNLRRLTARVLLIDECDAMEVGKEGSPIKLAEKRTLSFPNRKIVCGSTPTDESTSHIARLYAQSDQRVFEVPCPACKNFAEIRWADIEWEPDKPETAAWRCPACKALIDERHKAQMVREGRWRATRPEASGHAGFRLNALTSPLANAAWGKLAVEFLTAKTDPAELRVFINTVLGEVWRDEADQVDEAALAARVEGFDLDHIPPEVLAVTCGADCQDDRIEISVLGHARDGTVFVLAHETIWGDVLDGDTWAEVDKLLRQRWQHPLGGQLKVDSAVIDAGDGGHYDTVMAFANARLGRRVLAGKGVFGFSRAAISASKTKKGRLFIVGVDGLKSQIFARLARGNSIRFSHTLTPTYFEQLASEKKVVRHQRGRPVARFERKVGMRAETLDCLTYGLAAKAALSLNAASFDQRTDELRSPKPTVPPPTVIRSKWMERRT